MAQYVKWLVARLEERNHRINITAYPNLIDGLESDQKTITQKYDPIMGLPFILRLSRCVSIRYSGF